MQYVRVTTTYEVDSDVLAQVLHKHKNKRSLNVEAAVIELMNTDQLSRIHVSSELEELISRTDEDGKLNSLTYNVLGPRLVKVNAHG